MKFELDLRRSLTPGQHVGVGSGHSVVQPLIGSVCGVASLFSPPLYIRPLRFLVELELDGRRVVDDGNLGKGDCGLLYAGGTWSIDRITRKGTYHHRPEGKLFSLEVTSELFALRDRCGFALRITARNRCGRRVRLQAKPTLVKACPGMLPLSQWDYGVPGSTDDVTQTGEGRWANSGVTLQLHARELEWELEPDSSVTFDLALVATRAGETQAAAPDVKRWIDDTVIAWEERLGRAWQSFPKLTSDVPGLEDYYNRSLVSGLVCLWDRVEFVNNPFVATSGMDGGAICCYPWDTTGYAPNALAMLLGDKLGDLAKAMAAFGMDEHSRFSLDGTGRDVPYAYNSYCFISLLNASALHLGLDRSLYDYAKSVFLTLESRLNLRDHLADYGFQHNLLEMRQAGWEHFVASPNAERAWCYRRLADIGAKFGDEQADGWRREADAIIAAIRGRLWSEQAGFFRCLYPGSEEEIVLSIQGFDALRMGACTPSMKQAMLRHVREGAFLGEYGVSSVSAEDALHYELNDPDWSGGGSYTGDGPLLALTLWEQGEATMAWDVLRRHFWMGKHLVYYPQEHYSDRPAVPAHKRANIVAGLSGAEAILYGLVGLRLDLDGGLRLESGWPGGLRGGLELKNVRVRGRSFDVRVENGRATLTGQGD